MLFIKYSNLLLKEVSRSRLFLSNISIKRVPFNARPELTILLISEPFFIRVKLKIDSIFPPDLYRKLLV